MTKYRYRKQISIGYDSSGKRIRKWITANTQTELAEKISQAKKELEQTPNSSDITFDTYSERWLETYKAHKAINTKAGYEYSRQKCSALFRIPIKDIVKSDLQKIINHNINHPDTCRKIRLTLRQIFDAAIEDGIIASNPASKLEIPQHKAAEKRALTTAERKAIKSAKLDPADRMFLDLLYYCGLRRGEALALTRSDFDFKRLLLCVNKSVAFDGENPTVKDTKTHVKRYVPIPKAKSNKWKKTISGMPFALFAKGNQLFTRSVFRRMWSRIEKAINIELGAKENLKILHITPHMIRHDYATRLYYVPGISVKKKAEILGHSERLFTELYSHLDSEKEILKQFQTAMNW